MNLLLFTLAPRRLDPRISLYQTIEISQKSDLGTGNELVIILHILLCKPVDNLNPFCIRFILGNRKELMKEKTQLK